MGKRVHQFVTRRFDLLIAVAVAIYVLTFVVFSTLKFTNFGYNALDLGILNQTFSETIAGRPFASSIHPPTYLGDHFEPIILLLAPLYALIRHPITLLVLQAVALGCSAIPLVRIARRRLAPLPALGVGLVYLTNPFLHNTNAFEFHPLAFAPLALLATLDAWDSRRFRLFLLFIFVSLLVREDVGLVIAAFGLLSFVARRTRRWMFVPLAAGLAWFVGSLILIERWNPAGSYKFLVYYGWLGGSLGEAATNAVLKFHLVLGHLFRPENLIIAVALLLPFLLLPLGRPRFLLLALPPTLLLFLLDADPTIILFTHYTAPIFPFLVAAFMEGAVWLFRHPHRWRFLTFLAGERGLVAMLIASVALFSTVSLGPLLALGRGTNDAPGLHALLKEIPDDAAVGASLRTLPALSGRPDVTSLHYIFIGHQQFSTTLYTLPAHTSRLVIDADDFLTYPILFAGDPALSDAGERFDSMVTEGGFAATEAVGTTALLERNGQSGQLLVSRGPAGTAEPLATFGGAIALLDWQRDGVRQPDPLCPGRTVSCPLNLTLDWQRLSNLERANENWELVFMLTDSGGAVAWQQSWPVAWWLSPDQWRTDETVSARYSLLPDVLPGDYELSVHLNTIEGYLTTDAARSAGRQITERTERGTPFPLGSLSL